MIASFGEIYIVDFEPSTGHEYRGTRPAVVVQQGDDPEWPLVTVMPISSKLERRKDRDVFISKNEKNRLTHDSIIKTGWICTFDKRRCLVKIGQAESPVIRQVRGYLRRHFGL